MHFKNEYDESTEVYEERLEREKKHKYWCKSNCSIVNFISMLFLLY